MLLYNRACLEVLEGAMIGRGRTDLTPTEQLSRHAAFDRAMTLLRQAMDRGYRNLAIIRTIPTSNHCARAPISRYCSRISPFPTILSPPGSANRDRTRRTAPFTK